MRLVHLADIHLGFKQYERLTPAGINQREADVALTFRRVIDKVIELKPDLVLIAGDVFHAVRPGNPAILHAYYQFSRLMQSLPDATVVMVAGNHDTPRTRETGCILHLFTPLGITVVEGPVKRLTFHELDLSILAVPYMAPPVVPEPDAAAKYNIQLRHGLIEGIIPPGASDLGRRPMGITVRELRAEHFDYVALGHYHVYRSVAPNAFYSGSLDYTSTNAWGEQAEERASSSPEPRQDRESRTGGKGIIEHDLATGKHTFHRIPPLRQWNDLTPLSGAGMSPASLDEAIRAAVDGAEGGIDDKIVRLVIRDVPRHILRELDHRSLREYSRKALHFHLDTRRPEIVRRENGQGAPWGRRASLADTVRDKLRTRVLTENIDRETLVELGLHYLREADLVAGPTEEDVLA
ncbi:MAG: DNA repair exonuclease [Gemmatimonadales bacterium]